MKRKKSSYLLLALATLPAVVVGGAILSAQNAVERYHNFNVAIDCPIGDMRRMAADPKFMQESFDVIHGSIKFTKVWLETYRGNQEIWRGRRAKGQAVLREQGNQDVRRHNGLPGRAGRRNPVLLLDQSRAAGTVPEDGGLRRQHLRRNHFRRPVHVQLPLRTVPAGQGQQELDGVPAGGDERGRREPGSQERQERQPQDQPDLQTTKLV